MSRKPTEKVTNVCVSCVLFCVFFLFVFVGRCNCEIHLPECGRETFNDDPLAVSPSLRLIPIQPPMFLSFFFFLLMLKCEIDSVKSSPIVFNTNAVNGWMQHGTAQQTKPDCSNDVIIVLLDNFPWYYFIHTYHPDISRFFFFFAFCLRFASISQFLSIDVILFKLCCFYKFAILNCLDV